MKKPEDKITELYATYLNVIQPLMLELEILDNAFPVEILNEIRATFSHLAKFSLSDNENIQSKNLTKAEGHIKRAILDCYKYLCAAYADQVMLFDYRYRNVDLSLIEDGKFLDRLVKTERTAKEHIREARRTDLEIDSDDPEHTDNAYALYEYAYLKYVDLYNLLEGVTDKTERLKRKTIKDANRWNGIIAVIGIIFTTAIAFYLAH